MNGLRHLRPLQMRQLYQACVAPVSLHWSTISQDESLKMKDEMEQVQENKTRDFPVNALLEAAITNRMSAAQNVYLYGIWRRVLWKLPILNHTMSKVALLSTNSDIVMNDQATYVTKNQRM